MSAWGVNDEVDLTILHHIYYVRTLLLSELIEALYVNTLVGEPTIGASSGVNFEA